MKTTSYDENVFNAKNVFGQACQFRVETLKIQDGGFKIKILYSRFLEA
jgi:hypothetical protein